MDLAEDKMREHRDLWRGPGHTSAGEAGRLCPAAPPVGQDLSYHASGFT